jgi:hypothetical protein
MRDGTRWTALAAIAIFSANLQFARGDQGLTGEVRTTFVEATIRSCLKTQLDAPSNRGFPVSAIFDYCKCNATGLADKISNDEVKSLEAAGSEQKARTAMQARLEASAKTCLETTIKSLRN